MFTVQLTGAIAVALTRSKQGSQGDARKQRGQPGRRRLWSGCGVGSVHPPPIVVHVGRRVLCPCGSPAGGTCKDGPGEATYLSQWVLVSGFLLSFPGDDADSLQVDH